MKQVDEVTYVPGFIGKDGKATSKPTAKDYAANKEYQHMKKKLGNRIPGPKPTKEGIMDKVKTGLKSLKDFHKTEVAAQIRKNKTTKTVGEEYTDKEVKMGKGVAFDKRYKGGNYTGAYKTIEKIKKGLAKHPKVADALRRANEETLQSFTEVAGQRGRPKRGEDGESDKHIIMQLRSAQDLGGNKHITFRGGKQAKVHPDHINKILKAHDHPSMKPVHKRMLRVAISKGPEHLARVAKAIKH